MSVRALALTLGVSQLLGACDPSDGVRPAGPSSVESRSKGEATAQRGKISSQAPSSSSLGGEGEGDDVAVLIEWLLDDSRQLDGVRFADVIQATSGKEILPFSRNEDPVVDEIYGAISMAMGASLLVLNGEESPIRNLGRINEASRYFEEEMMTRLEAIEGFRCSVPPLADGKEQRSGYPDLKLVHEASGRVTYIDPKLFEETSIKSSLRTFYFEPKTKTNKVLDDAHHLLIGIAHDGNTGHWKFTTWHPVDLSEFRVRLKAEFQASNKDLYREEHLVPKEK